MLYFDKINVSEGIEVNKSNKSKECMNWHYWNFVDINYTYKPEVCNGCHGMTIMVYELENMAILNVKDVDSRCGIWNMTKNDTSSYKWIDLGQLF